MLSSIASYSDHHKLSLKLKPILVGELYLVRRLTHPAYVFKGGAFHSIIPDGSAPTKDQINLLIKNGHREVFLYPEDIRQIHTNLESALIKITRSLSVGDPLENGTKDLKLLSLNLGNLYQNPHNDDLLMLQFQSSQNLAKFILENKRLQSQLFQNLQKENFHFTMTQPMLSSLMLTSFLQNIHLFHEREIENIFLASYLKDIGMAMIPRDKYDEKELSRRDKNLFANHADFSTDILDGRIPLSKNYFTMIRNHHFLNDKVKEILTKTKREKSQEVILGLETTLLAVFDILVAMTSERPYRKATSLFQSLELIKLMMADDYPQEFRALIVFLKQFYKM